MEQYRLQTPVTLPPSPALGLSYGQAVLSLGSCFSEHIGMHLQQLGHRVCLNPFGILYNPLSMVQALGRMRLARLYSEEELVAHADLYHSMDHHGSFSHPDAEEVLARVNASLMQGHEALQDIRYLMLTWGTAYVYSLRSTGAVVGNCHKIPEGQFVRRLYQPDELYERVAPLLQALLDEHKDLQIITSISPIRHLRDGAQGNQLSKASLMLMNHRLCAMAPERIHYFPAYEIVQDELRDYRFYAEDLTHPAPITQRIVRDRLTAWLVSDERTLTGMKIASKLYAEYAHRPLHAESLEAEMRREQMLARIAGFLRTYPDADLSSWLRAEDNPTLY